MGWACLPIFTNHHDFQKSEERKYYTETYLACRKMPIEDVMKKHVWLLSTIADMPNGEKKIVHRTRAPRVTPTKEKLATELRSLTENGVEMVWVTRKYPLLVFLWPAVIPMFIIGGPMAFIMPVLGI